MISESFQKAAPWILDAEAGFVNDPDDRGGATNHGWTLATLKTLPDANGDGFADGDIDEDGDVDINDIRNMRSDQAIDNYYAHIWQPNRCDELPTALAICLFDGLVNHRPGPAKRLLQMGIGVTADGKIGPNTIYFAHQSDLRQVLPNYFSFRADFYAHIVTADSSQSKFRRGWFRRLFLLQQYLQEHVL